MSFTNVAQVTPPAVEPVSLARVKHHLGIPAEMAEDDTYLMSLISAARRLAEVRTGRAIMASKWRAGLSQATYVGRCGCAARGPAPHGFESLPRWPVLYGDQYPVAVFTEDDQGALVPVDASGVHVHRLHDAVAVDGGWRSGMWVEWWAGAADSSEVEETVKAAICMMVAIFYSNRGDGTQDGETATAWDAVAALLMAEWDGRIYR